MPDIFKKFQRHWGIGADVPYITDGTIGTMCWVRSKLRARAGVKNKMIPVRIVDHHGLLPPSLRKLKRTSERREVVVSVQWLMTKEPKLWTMVAAAHLHRGADRIPITPLKQRNS